MIASNQMTLKQPYGLYRNRFLSQLYTEAFERKIVNSQTDLTSYKTILSTEAIRLFKPEMWQALEDQRLNLAAIKRGANMDPPQIIAPIETDVNLPLDPPTHTPIPAQTNQIPIWKIKAAITNDFVAAKADFKEKIMKQIPVEIFNSLKLKGGARGWAAIEPADCFELILSEEYGNVSTEETKSALEKISALWNRDLPLKTNIENMIEMNIIVGAAFPHLHKSDQEMFRIAHDIAILPLYDLATTVDDFMDLEEQDYNTSVFSEFSKYLWIKYTNRRKLPNLGHLAFSDETRYIKKINNYALAAPADKVDSGGLALAANALPNPAAAKANPHAPAWKKGEYEEYLELRKAKNNPKRQFAVPPPPPSAPAGAIFGKLCFNCGWNKNHNSRSCPVMYNAPPNKFSTEMKNLVRFDPKTDPPTIGGIPINQQCAPGVYGTY